MTKILSDFLKYIPRASQSRKGKPVIIDNRDYMYIIEKESIKNTMWRCRSFASNSYNCRARVFTKNGYIIKFSNEHNHSPPIIP